MPRCKLPRALLSVFLSAAVLSSQTPNPGVSSFQADTAALPPIVQTVLYSITAADLKGDVSFLASDVLQGRYTPSAGLDVAAEFIAAEFRAAGVEPCGDQDYFQTATMIDRHLPKLQTDMIVREGSDTISIPAQSITALDASQSVNIDRAPVIVFSSKDPDALKGLDLTGKTVIVPEQQLARAPREQLAARKRRAFDKAVASSNAAIEIVVGQQRQPQTSTKLLLTTEAQEHRLPVISVTSEDLQRWLDQPDTGSENRTVSINIPAPDDHRVVLKNVVGILRGSDPSLRDTAILLTAHYDHIGTVDTAGRAAASRPQNPNDRIYNGANDDASGTVSVIAIAKALAKLNPHPKRSIVFIAFFGEERGEVGSQYYARHPAFPLAKTVAAVNLEQLGRTDSTVGRQFNNASLTGYDYSDVPNFFEEAGRQTGIKVYMDKEATDAYFTRSDNAALAEEGVPAHSVAVAFDFPDYHGVGDRWQKIDYENMARVDRMIALGVLNIANSIKVPQWNAQNPRVAPFREAQQKLLRLPRAG
jgi:Zn-dependent M28 family amino/carboxypeptidase